jgi:glutamate-1-semialdehyde 2,1-aminomutase
MGTKSSKLFAKARTLIPGGVNSPVRAGKAVGLDPPFIARARGCYLWDVDRKRYIDYVCSWGPMVLGHAHPKVVKALEQRVPKGTSYGAPTQLEVEMAQTITEMVPSVEMVRMVNSGTEAAMSAIRLARGYTGREKIIKFEGCYHGHADSLLVSAGSGVATLGIPGCPGVPADLAGHTLSLRFNDLAQVAETMERFGQEVAAVVVEPIAGNMGVVLPREGFLEGLREITLQHGALLIFDEVITGFRVSPGGAQELYGIRPDLTCLGKIIGGGLPVGAYGGRKEIMLSMAPEGNIYQAGTLSGNPLAMAAGLATLKELRKGGVYSQLEEKGRRLFDGLKDAAESAGLDVAVNRAGSLGTLFFTREPVTDFASAKKSDTRLYGIFYSKMLDQGIYLAPSAFEAWFLSLAHDDRSIDKTIACSERAFRGISVTKNSLT